MKVICPECKKKFAGQEYLDLHMGYAHPKAIGEPKSKGWRTPYGFVDFTEPVTYEHACNTTKEAMSKINMPCEWQDIPLRPEANSTTRESNE